MLRTVPTDNINAIVLALVDSAKHGDLAAAKLVLDYCLGRPNDADQVSS